MTSEGDEHDKIDIGIQSWNQNQTGKRTEKEFRYRINSLNILRFISHSCFMHLVTVCNKNKCNVNIIISKC